MSKSKIFFLFLLSFVGGVGVASFLYPKIWDNFWIFVGLIISLIAIFVFWEKKSVVIFGSALVFFWGGVYLAEKRIAEIRALPESFSFSGEVRIVDEPELKNSGQKIKVFFPEKKFEIILDTRTLENYRYGDWLQVSCLAKRPENFSSDFDYQMYLAKERVFYVCANPEIQKTGRRDGNWIFGFLLEARKRLNDNIARLIPAPEAGLLSGIILGGDGLLSKDYQQYFSRTGLTHIVAVSGYNVTIVAEYLMLLGIFLGLWRGQAFYAAVLGIILFVIMTGAPASAVRAGVMGGLLLWAVKNGRLANAGNAIMLSGVVMLIFNPLLLRWDVGFQLSFLATLGIVYLYPVLDEYFLRKKSDKLAFAQTVGFFGEVLLLTLAAQIFVLPIILFNFSSLSLISPLANLLVLPIIPLTMLLGFLMIMLSFVFLPLGTVFAWLTYLPLRYETMVVKYLSGLKYAAIEVKLTWLGVLVWYIILSGGVYYFRKNEKQNES